VTICTTAGVNSLTTSTVVTPSCPGRGETRAAAVDPLSSNGVGDDCAAGTPSVRGGALVAIGAGSRMAGWTGTASGWEGAVVTNGAASSVGVSLPQALSSRTDTRATISSERLYRQLHSS